MTIFSSVRSQRGTSRKTEVTEQLISFQLRGEWFALPMKAVQRVIPLGKTHGDPSNTGISLALYQGQEITVVDVGRRIFDDAPDLDDAKAVPFAAKAEDNVSQQRCLVLVQNSEGSVVGIPIDSQPLIRRAEKSQFSPLPSSYQNRGNIHCISSMVVDDGGLDPLFLLDPEQLNLI